MEATLKFTLPEEELEFHDASHGTGYRNVCRTIVETLRNKIKHGHNIVSADAALNVIYDEVLEELASRGLDVYNP